MNARLYDAKVHRFLAPDNYVQDPYNTQNYNRYSYVLNNPLSYSDPSGDSIVLVAAIIGAVIGGATAAIRGGDVFDIFAGALIGGFIGGLSTGVGNLAVGGAFAGNAATSVVGFWSGAAAGGASGFTTGFLGTTIAAMQNGNGFGDALLKGLKGGLISGVIGSAIGGVSGGVRARKENVNFWNAKTELDLSNGYGAHGVKNLNRTITGTLKGKFEGVNVFESSMMAGKNGGFSGVTLPGRGIIVSPNVFVDRFKNTRFLALLQHEYGHILQSNKHGLIAFYSVIGKESLASASFTSMESHNNFWTETYANYLSKDYFGSLTNIGALQNYPIQKITSFNLLRLQNASLIPKNPILFKPPWGF